MNNYLKHFSVAVLITALVCIFLSSCSKEKMNSTTSYSGTEGTLFRQYKAMYTIQIKGQEVYLYRGSSASGQRWDMEKVGQQYQSKDPRYKDTYYFRYEDGIKKINLRFGENTFFYGEKVQ